MNTIPHFISGKKTFDPKAKTLPVFNPALGEEIAKVAIAGHKEIEAAIASAKKAYESWSELPPAKRAQVLFKFKNLIETNLETLAKLVTTEHGKLFEDAKGSVQRGLEIVDYYCGIPNLLHGEFSENIAKDMDCYTIRQPLGICVGVSPFNFPVMIPLWMMVPAIACGNCFILKPSEKDPSAPLLLAELFHEAGLPEGVLTILNGEKSVVSQLITHPDVAAVTCVGSTPVAKLIYETAVTHGKRAHTFGGAKNHCIVMPDADLTSASEIVGGAAFGAAGERCMALSAAIVIGDKRADEFVEITGDYAKKLVLGSGMDEGSHMGPLVSEEHLQRVKNYIDLGIEEGAVLVEDGRKSFKQNGSNGFFLGASIFDFVQTSMRIYQEEIFGPILSVVRADNFEQAIKIINQNPHGNGTAIFTHDGKAARAFAHRVHVGMVGINVAIPVPVAYQTFGGWKDSFFGDIAMHADSVNFYTRKKSITSKW